MTTATERIEEIKRWVMSNDTEFPKRDPLRDRYFIEEFKFLLKAYDEMRNVAFIHFDREMNLSDKSIREFIDQRFIERMK